MKDKKEEERKPYTILLYQSEVDFVRDETKVDAVAPAVVALIRKAKEAKCK